MTILRVKKKTANFVILDNTFLNDTRLPLKAKGLLAYLLSRPDDWHVYIDHLVKQSPDGRDAIYGALKSLKELGYVIMDQPRKVNGKFSAREYLVFETPQIQTNTVELTESSQPENNIEITPHTEKPEAEPLTENPYTVFPDPAKPYTANPTLLNNELNNNKINKQQTTTKSQVSATFATETYHVQSVAAVAVDNFINGSITTSQRKSIAAMIEELSQAMPLSSPGSLCAEIEVCVLDKNSFSQAGNDFIRKLNTIKKCIKQGKWRAPAIAPISTKPNIDPKIQTLQETLRNEEFNTCMLQQRIQELSTSQDKPSLNLCELLKKELPQKIQLIEDLQHKLAILQSGENYAV